MVQITYDSPMSVDSVANFATRRLCSAYRRKPRKPDFHTGLAVILAAGVTASCSQGVPLRSSEQTRMVPTEQAFVLPEPGGPAVTAVVETSYSNATQQDVLLATSAATPGQNMIRIQVFGPLDPKLAGPERLRAGHLPARNVSAEMRELFPGVRMRTSAYYVQNNYGPFGYAVGRAGTGDTCFYGWQRITSTGATQTLVGNKGSIQLRLRLCDENASEERLLQVMYGYTVTASFRDRNWNPYGKPPPVDERLGRSGAPIYPEIAPRREVADEPIGVAAAPKRVVRTARSESGMAAPAALPAPVGPRVPPPPGSGVVSSAPPIGAQEATAPTGTAPVVPLPP